MKCQSRRSTTTTTPWKRPVQVGIKAFSPDLSSETCVSHTPSSSKFPVLRRTPQNILISVKDAAAAVVKAAGFSEVPLGALWATIIDSVKGEFAPVSRAHTSVSHIFHHADVLHWATNIFSIVSTGLKLSLVSSRSILIVGGGTFGSWPIVIEWQYYRPLTPSTAPSTDQNTRQMDIVDLVTTGVREVRKQLGISGAQSPYIIERRRHVFCWASASAFALIGACLFVKETVPVSRRPAGRFRSSGNMIEESVLKNRLEQLAWQLSARLLTIGADVLAVKQWTYPSNLSHIYAL